MQTTLLHSLRRFTLTCLPMLAMLLWSESLMAQSYSVSGTVTALDEHTEEPLAGANIRIYTLPDTTMLRGTTSGRDGTFALRNVASGRYLLRVSYIGFLTESLPLTIESEGHDDLMIRLRDMTMEMSALQVTGRRPRVEVQGDTTSFHADGYRLNRDASAGDLVRRMPGFMMEDGRLQAQGEEVQRVLVDGEEFFGDDAALTLRNLPAEIIEKIEVSDRQSDQARFTGFDDGETQRTINIVTRDGLNRGRFGRANSGYGSETRYMAGGNLNLFEGDRRISLLGLSNNINQQNFSSEDLIGVTGGGGGGGRGGRGGGSARDFQIGTQSGISSVHSTGLNYNDTWGESWKINSSYFFNMSDNINDQNRERRYLTGVAADQIYGEETYNTSDNYNHRFNARLEHTIDERRSLIISPRVSVQQNQSLRTLEGTTFSDGFSLLNQLSSQNDARNTGYNIASNILYRHRFEKEGRTFSANIHGRLDNRSGDRIQNDESYYYGEDGDENLIATYQQTDMLSDGYSLSGNLSWTEPVTSWSQVMLSYRPSVNLNNSIQDAWMFDDQTGTYSRLDTTLSNRYDNLITTHQTRGSFRVRGENFNADVSLSLQHRNLEGDQQFPDVVQTSRNWQNLLPGASLRYNFSRGTNLRFSYSTQTRTPSARQLQDVIDNSDPLRLTSGNPGLNQQFDHRFNLRFRSAQAEKGTSTMAWVSMNFTQNHIGNRTFIAPADTVLQDGIILGRGGRLIAPDNIGESWRINSMINRSLPLDLIRSNLSLNSGVSYSRNPSMVDGDRNLADNVGFRAGISASSNISEEVDFRFSYRASYHMVSHSIQPELDTRYYSGRASGAFNLMPWGGLVLASDLSLRHYQGLGDAYNEGTLHWNGALAYKFLHNRAAELRLTVFDILAQNNHVDRSISEDYIEDYRSNVLSRYVLLSFSYNFRSFSGGL